MYFFLFKTEGKNDYYNYENDIMNVIFLVISRFLCVASMLIIRMVNYNDNFNELN